jgi:hypothetical protein
MRLWTGHSQITFLLRYEIAANRYAGSCVVSPEWKIPGGIRQSFPLATAMRVKGSTGRSEVTGLAPLKHGISPSCYIGPIAFDVHPLGNERLV